MDQEGIRHTESGESMLQATPEEPNGQPLSLLILKMLLYSVDDTGAHMVQKFLDTRPHSSPNMSISVEQLVKGVRTLAPTPSHLYPDYILPSGRVIDSNICVLFSHLTTLA